MNNSTSIFSAFSSISLSQQWQLKNMAVNQHVPIGKLLLYTTLREKLADSDFCDNYLSKKNP